MSSYSFVASADIGWHLFAVKQYHHFFVAEDPVEEVVKVEPAKAILSEIRGVLKDGAELGYTWETFPSAFFGANRPPSRFGSENRWPFSPKSAPKPDLFDLLNLFIGGGSVSRRKSLSTILGISRGVKPS